MTAARIMVMEGGRGQWPGDTARISASEGVYEQTASPWGQGSPSSAFQISSAIS
jgi:hypothetical protein